MSKKAGFAMLKRLVLICALLLLAAPAALASQPMMVSKEAMPPGEALDVLAAGLIDQLELGQVSSVAVLDPGGSDRPLNDFDAYVVEELTIRLTRATKRNRYFMSRKVFTDVLERRRLHEIIMQQRIEISTHFDRQSATSLGKKLKVSAVVVLTLRDLGDSMHLTAQVQGVAKGNILAGASVRLAKTQAVEHMLATPLTARLILNISPQVPGAQVTLDGETREVTGPRVVFDKAPQGVRKLLISAPCYKNYRLPFYLAGRRTMEIELEPKRGTLQLTVVPPTAQVTVDGKDRVDLDGNGVGSLELPAGAHTLSVLVPGKEPMQRRVILGCQPLSLFLDTTKKKVRLSLKVMPPTARVILDGEALGLSPQGEWSGDVIPGPHRLSAQAPDHDSKSYTLDVEQACPHTIKLKAHTFRLSVRHDPDHAQVFIDGKPTDRKGPGLSTAELPVGAYDLTVSAPGYQPWQQQVDLRQARTVKVELTKIPLDLRLTAWYEDDFGRLRALRPGQSLRSGQGYAFKVRPSLEAYLYVFQVDSLGKVAQLFPNQEFSSLRNPLQANREYQIPSRYKVFELDNNRGMERVFFVVSRRPDRRLEGLYEQLLTATDGTQARSAARDNLLNNLRTRGVAKARPAGNQQVEHNGQVFDVASQVLKSSGAGETHSFEFQHR